MTKVINSITVAALTAVQASIVNQARKAAPDRRGQGADERKQIKREVFGVVKAKFGIDPSVKVMANTSNPQNPEYLVLHVAGKRNPNRGKAFRLNGEGKWDGTYVTKDQLFPPPAPAQTNPAPSTDGNASGSVFGGAAGNWFRLDPQVVAGVLTASNIEDYLDGQSNSDTYYEAVPTTGEGGALPEPNLKLAGRDDLAIVQDGSIYRRIDQ